MSNKLSATLLFLVPVLCLVGTSHARPISPLTERIHDNALNVTSSQDVQATAQPGSDDWLLPSIAEAPAAKISVVNFANLGVLPNYNGSRDVSINSRFTNWRGAGSFGRHWLVQDGGVGPASPRIKVPEPGPLALLALGLVGMALVRRRRVR